MAGGHSSWREEDLLDLERCGLAAELASTNLGSGNGWGQGNNMEPVDITYDMTEVLGNLLESEPLLNPPLQLPQQMATPTATPTHLPVQALLKAPSAYGIKTDQEKVTYLNRGQSYEILLQHSLANPVLYSCTLSLTFCEIRWRNSEREHFEQWSKDHPCDRLLEIDLSGCQGLRTVQNSDEANLACAHFTWGHTDTATVALKVNCLSTEFAIRKHGGEKGVPLRLYLEMRRCECELEAGHSHNGSCEVVYQGACGVKVFKDKGGDRKQRQDQTKIEKLPPNEKAKYHCSEMNTWFEATQLDSSYSCTPLSAKSDNTSVGSCTPGASPYSIAAVVSVAPPQATPPSLPHPHPHSVTGGHSSIVSCTSVADSQKWLLLNRFGQYCSLFANYSGTDLMCLSRQDLMDLCGHADGIRLYNSVHSRVLKTLYVLFQQEDKVYQAICLEELTAKELLMRLLEKLPWLEAKQVSSFLRLTANNLLVRMDDLVVQGIAEEHQFRLRTVKDEDGSYQVVLADHTPPHHDLAISLAGSTPRR